MKLNFRVSRTRSKILRVENLLQGYFTQQFYLTPVLTETFWQRKVHDQRPPPRFYFFQIEVEIFQIQFLKTRKNQLGYRKDRDKGA